MNVLYNTTIEAHGISTEAENIFFPAKLHPGEQCWAIKCNMLDPKLTTHQWHALYVFKLNQGTFKKYNLLINCKLHLF
jgi:hypothetical protein